MQMRGMLNRCGGTLVATAFVLGLAGGCSTNTEMGGVRIPNAAPDTRVTGQPPTLLEASYAVEFRWTGSDPDGRIRGYQWKMSDNGVDGISPQDTLTVDPLTGAVLHPWHFTTGTDSTFLVLADQPSFPPDDDGNPNTRNERSYRSHSPVHPRHRRQGCRRSDSRPISRSRRRRSCRPAAWTFLVWAASRPTRCRRR